MPTFTELNRQLLAQAAKKQAQQRSMANSQRPQQSKSNSYKNLNAKKKNKKTHNKNSLFYEPHTTPKPTQSQTSTEWTTVKKKKRKKKPITPIDPSQVSQYIESNNFSRKTYPHGPYVCVFCEKSFNAKTNLRGITNPNCDKCYHSKLPKS